MLKRTLITLSILLAIAQITGCDSSDDDDSSDSDSESCEQQAAGCDEDKQDGTNAVKVAPTRPGDSKVGEKPMKKFKEKMESKVKTRRCIQNYIYYVLM